MPRALAAGTLRNRSINKHYRPKDSRNTTARKQISPVISPPETVSTVSSLNSHRSEVSEMTMNDHEFAVTRPPENSLANKLRLGPNPVVPAVYSCQVSAQAPKAAGSQITSPRLALHAQTCIPQNTPQGQQYVTARPNGSSLAAMAGRTAFLRSPTPKAIPPSMQTLRSAEDGSFLGSGRNELTNDQAFELRQNVQPYQLPPWLQDSHVVRSPQEQTISKPKKTDFDKLKAALHPRRNVLDDYQDDGALRRAEKQRLLAEEAQRNFPAEQAAREAAREKAREKARIKASKGPWQQIINTAKQLSPKLSPKLAAKFSESFSAMKKSRREKKAEKAQAATEVAKAHQDAATWAEPRTSEAGSHKAWIEQQKWRQDMKSKISRPIDHGGVFMADQFEPSAVENSTHLYAGESKERGNATESAFANDRDKSRITTVGAFIDADSLPRLDYRIENYSPQEQLFTPSKRTNSTRKQQESCQPGFDYKCVGLDGPFATAAAPDQGCLVCGQAGVMQESGMCHGCTYYRN